MNKSYLVTGGTGFLGSALVRRMVREGYSVRVLDNNTRGALRRISDVISEVDFVAGDIRDAKAVHDAAAGMDGIVHLAYVNGTEFFYSMPEVVLDVGVRGMLNVLDACRAHDIGELVVASSSEVYQTAPNVPTGEDAPLSVPDPLNPRYSYGGGKIICELMAINYGRKGFEKVVIFRPHNVIGPDMGFEHVLPQFVLRMKRLVEEHPHGMVPFSIQGSGRETRSFIDIEDSIDAVLLCMTRGEHLNIYHIGTEHEREIRDVAHAVAVYFGREIDLLPGPQAMGGTLRRCPDMRKLRALGFDPAIPFEETLSRLADWYVANAPAA